MPEPLLVAKSQATELALLPALANRHGLIAGATGTGKTVTLQALAERFSRIGVPVFMADVKGDLAGLAAAGALSPKMQPSVSKRSSSRSPCAAPARSCSGTSSASRAIRCARRSPTWGRCCSARLLNLNETQEGVLDARLQDRRRQRACCCST